MNQRDLEYFVKVVETGSFSQASIVLGIAQPAISRYVKELEVELQINLLYRNGRGVVLTQAGERLYARATAILEQMAETRREALNFSGNKLVGATIGMPASVARILVQPLSELLKDRFPSAKVKIIEAFNGHLLEWLTAGRLDISILYDTEASRRLHADPLFSDHLSLICPAAQTPCCGPVGGSEIVQIPLVLPSRPHGLRHHVDTWATKNGIDLKIDAECDGYVSMLQLVMSGDYCTILPRTAVLNEVRNGLLHEYAIVSPPIERRMVLAMPSNRPHQGGMAELSRMVKQVVRQMDAKGSLSTKTAPESTPAAIDA